MILVEALPPADRSLYADGVTDPLVSLDVDRVAVEPGGQASVTIKIINPGTIVEGYRVEVIGEGVADWGEALPPEISIYPQQDATAVIVFSPPGGTGAPGGTWPFGIRVRSTEDAEASAVVEGDLEIGKVFGLQAKLLPVNSSGRWRGRHVVQLSNWGNAPARLKLTAANPDDALGFLIRPDVVELALGGTGTAMVWVKTKTPTLRGTPTRIPFTVTGEPVDAPAQSGPLPAYGGSPDRPTVDGAFNQKPILATGAIMLLALVLLAVGGGVAWALTRPLPPGATFQELGPPEAPSEVKVAPVGPESVEVSWSAVPNVEGYTVVEVRDASTTGSRPVPGTDTATTIDGLAPTSTVCFAVQSRRGDLTSPFTEKQCAATPAALPTASPSTTVSAASPSVAVLTGWRGWSHRRRWRTGSRAPERGLEPTADHQPLLDAGFLARDRHDRRRWLPGQVVRGGLVAGHREHLRPAGEAGGAAGGGRPRGDRLQPPVPERRAALPGRELGALSRSRRQQGRRGSRLRDLHHGAPVLPGHPARSLRSVVGRVSGRADGRTA